MRLADLQRRMTRAVLGGDHRALPTLARGPVSAETAFAVHRNTIQGALCNALRLSFPTIDTLVGAAFFDQAACAYAAAHPPTSSRLSTYGARFPAFLEIYAPAVHLAYLADVARLDLAIDRALASADSCVRRCIAIDARVSLALPISLETLLLSFPADLIRAGLDDGDDEALAAIDVGPQPRAVAVWRTGRQAAVRPLSPPAVLFLAGVLDGASADEALAAVFVAHTPQPALHAIQAEIFAAPFAQITQTRSEDQTP